MPKRDQTPQGDDAAPQGTEDPFDGESPTQDRQDAISTTRGADTETYGYPTETATAAATPAGRSYGDVLHGTDKEDPGASDPADRTQAETGDTSNDGSAEADVQARKDAEDEVGYRGQKVDPTPNEAYTLAGVNRGDEVPSITDPHTSVASTQPQIIEPGGEVEA